MADLGTLVPASPLDISDDSRLAFTTDSDETLSRILGDTPATFGSISSLSWVVEYRLGAARNNDTYSLGIYIANGATQLAGGSATLGVAQEVSASVTLTTDTTSVATAFTYINTTADKATWDGASVYLVQTYAKSQGGDGVGIEVDYVALTGSFTAVDVLLSTSVEASSSVSSPALGQIHNILTNGVDSTSSVSSPTITQAHTILTNSVESVGGVSSPGLVPRHNLLANDVESSANVTAPTLGVTHNILSNSLDSASTLSSPALVNIIPPSSYYVNVPANFVSYHVNMPIGYLGYHVKVV